MAEPFFVDLSKPKEHVQNDSHCTVDLNVSPSEHRSENNSEDLDSEVLQGMERSLFHYIINVFRNHYDMQESIAGSDVTNRLQSNEICCSETSFLHDNPHKSVDCR